ncbi:hypothetical protein ACFLZM_08350 [Thermodesulfobacteriota bacterium]
MKNPFSEFGAVPYRKQEIPLERIVKAKHDTLKHLVENYISLVEAEAKDLVWLVEHSRLVQTYEQITQTIQNFDYDQDDIEDFCLELDNSDKIPYMISGPAGIFISALINHLQEEQITLNLQDYKRTFHFLGYRLPEGKELTLKGNIGDFIGSGLAGGRVQVDGSTRNWLGAGMTSGRIFVTGHTGQKTGEWMRGGEIHVDGPIHNVGTVLYGGKIYRQGSLIYPKDA